MSVDLTSLLIGGGGSLLGLVGGAVGLGARRELNFNRRVDERLKKLEDDVESCKQRDGHIAILSLGLKLTVPEVQRLDPRNPVLGQVMGALSALPVEDRSFDELMAALKEID